MAAIVVVAAFLPRLHASESQVRRPAAASPAPAVASAPADTTSYVAPARPKKRSTRTRRAPLLPFARRFLNRYLAYGYGRASRAAVAGFLTPQLARSLPDRVRRVPAARSRPRVLAVTPVQRSATQVQFMAFVDDGARRYDVRFVVVADGRGWRVGELGGTGE